MKLNLGCGGNKLPGWHNCDIEVDITKRLPFENASADFVFCEHCMEHVSPADAWRFMGELLRILKPDGVVRLAVPSIERVYDDATPAYLAWLKQAKFGDGTLKSAVENLICGHGHQAIWSIGLLQTCLLAVGFSEVAEVRVGQSEHEELRGVEGHGKVLGEENNLIETIVVEALK